MPRLLVTVVIVVVLVHVNVPKLLEVTFDVNTRLDDPFVQYIVVTRYDVTVVVFEVTE